MSTEDDAWQIHYTTECKPENYEKAKAERKMCQANRCGATLKPVNTYICKNCNKELCLKHRFESEHECKYVKKKERKLNEEEKITLGPFKPIEAK